MTKQNKGEGGKSKKGQRKGTSGEQLLLPYDQALHAVQAGVAMEMELDKQDEGEAWHDKHHKHLRVGVNSAMCEIGTLQALLIRKGIITREEFVEALTQMVNEEKVRYEHGLAQRLGTQVKLAGVPGQFDIL